jgi:hypothetical protein
MCEKIKKMETEQTNVLIDLPTFQSSSKEVVDLRRHTEDIKMHILDMMAKIEYMKARSG